MNAWQGIGADGVHGLVRLYVELRYGSSDPCMHAAAAQLRSVLEDADVDVERLAEGHRCSDVTCGDPLDSADDEYCTRHQICTSCGDAIDGADHPYCVGCQMQRSLPEEDEMTEDDCVRARAQAGAMFNMLHRWVPEDVASQRSNNIAQATMGMEPSAEVHTAIVAGLRRSEATAHLTNSQVAAVMHAWLWPGGVTSGHMHQVAAMCQGLGLSVATAAEAVAIAGRVAA